MVILLSTINIHNLKGKSIINLYYINILAVPSIDIKTCIVNHKEEQAKGKVEANGKKRKHEA